MIEIQAYDTQGSAGEKTAFEEAVFGSEVNQVLLRQVIRSYEANQRVGTRHAKTRGEVEATSKKMYRQKHTGNARAGSRAVGQRRGGGKAHAPQAQDWSQVLPRKLRRQAIKSAALSRLQDGEVSLIESLTLETPSTKTVASILKQMGVSGSCLIVVQGEPDAVRTIWQSARNIPGVEVRTVGDLNAYDLMKPDRVIFTRPAFDAFREARAS